MKSTRPGQRFKLSLREQMERNQKSLDLYAAMSGKPRVELDIPAKRERAAAGSDGRPLERDVQAAIVRMLGAHERVAWYMRVNSGVANGGGQEARYTPFYRLYLRDRKPISRGLGDILGQLTDGRLFLMEVKRPGVYRGTEEQELIIAAVLAAGGVAGIVQSVDDAAELLKGMRYAY